MGKTILKIKTIGQECHVTTQTIEPFLDISIPIRSGASNMGGSSGGRNRKGKGKGKASAMGWSSNTADTSWIPDEDSKPKSAKALKKQRKKEEVARKRAAKIAKREAKRAAKGKDKGKGNDSKGTIDAGEPDATADGNADADGADSADGEGFGFGDDELDADNFVNGGPGDLDSAIAAEASGGDGGSVDGDGPEIPVEYGPIRDPPETRPGECSVYTCFQAFCAEEVLDGDNKYACESCYKKKHGTASKQRTGSSSSAGSVSVSSSGSGASSVSTEPGIIKTKAVKQLLVKNASHILTLHLKRFEQRGYRMEKVAKHVKFPMVLDISYFCGKGCELSVYDEGDTGVRYGLYGVVVHQGKISSGHYIAYVKTNAAAELNEVGGKVLSSGSSSSKSTWWQVSDTSVSRASEAQVLKAQAYLLFYERLA